MESVKCTYGICVVYGKTIFPPDNGTEWIGDVLVAKHWPYAMPKVSSYSGCEGQ